MAGRPHRSEKEAERTGTKDRAEYPSDDWLGIQPRYRAEAGKQEWGMMKPCHNRSFRLNFVYGCIVNYKVSSVNIKNKLFDFFCI
jgi:hypothetical protein